MNLKRWMAAFLAVVPAACTFQPCTYRVVHGETMGTTYTVKYIDPRGRDLSEAIQHALNAVDSSMSTYIAQSTISRFNRAADTFRTSDSLFWKVFDHARRIYQRTGGAFDPTVLPLVRHFGFGPPSPETAPPDSLCRLIGMDKIRRSGNILRKERPGVELDFGAIAKGFGVDEVARLLERHGIERYLVEVGGEVRARGKSCRNQYWRVGVNMPRPDAGPADIIQTIILRNEAVATSGSYRQFTTTEGDTLTHIIDPRRCASVGTQVVSVSIIAPDCTTADALATAAMVLPLDSAVQLIEQIPHAGGLWIVRTADGFDFRTTSLFRSRLVSF